jgi:hypothetical protein
VSEIEKSGVLAEAQALIVGLFEERLTLDETRRLETLVCGHSSVCELYVSMMHQRCAMSALSSPVETPLLSGDSGESPALQVTAADYPDGAEHGEANAHDTLHAQESMAGYRLEPAGARGRDAEEGGEAESPAPFWSPARQLAGARRLSRRMVVFSGLAACILIALGLTWYLNRGAGENTRIALRPQRLVLPRVLANVTASAGAQWAPGNGPIGAGVVTSNETLVLNKGCVEITFLCGARVVVEGPARFVARSETSMTLESGRLSAYAPDEAAGFVVDTPRAHVKDLGTEFGVAVQSNGDTLVHVYAGKVETFPTPANAAEADRAPLPATRPSLLAAGDAASVSPDDVTVMPGKASPQVFVRRIGTAKPALDVVDLVSGGDGTTHRRELAIDPATGESGILTKVDHWAGDGQYHGVPALPVVDGAFVPNGEGNRVDSAGHRFSFPPTMGMGFNRIWAGGAVPWPEKFRPPYTGRLGGVDYSAAERGLLLLHSNVGLTLDLDAIRRLHPGQRVVRFRSVAGNAAPPEVGTARADLFVLVDGVARFEHRGFANGQAPFNLDIPIRDGDRFLTLASTDGGDDNRFDWVTFGDPTLEIRAAEQAP